MNDQQRKLLFDTHDQDQRWESAIDWLDGLADNSAECVDRFHDVVNNSDWSRLRFAADHNQFYRTLTCRLCNLAMNEIALRLNRKRQDTKEL